MKNNYCDLNGEKIKLKKFSFSEEALKQYKKWFSDSIILKNLGYVGEFDETDIGRWEKSIKENSNQLMYNIVLNPSEKIIGMTSISICGDKKTGEIEILIGEKEFRNQGLGSETLSLLTKHSIEKLNLKNIRLIVLKDNIQAINCYKKAGFVFDIISSRNFESDRIEMCYKYGNEG